MFLKWTMAMLALVVCGGWSLVAAPEVAPQTFPCLSEMTLIDIRRTQSINEGFDACKLELREALGERFRGLSKKDLRAVYAMLAAHHIAPYGPSSESRFPQMLDEPTLNCGNQTLLTGYLFGPDDKDMRIMGFEGGAVGNHAQIYYQRGEVRLLLDPTIGMVARATSFDDMLSGKAISREDIRWFPREEAGEVKFSVLVIDAVLEGKYRPSDLLYYFESTRQMSVAKPGYYSRGGARMRARLAKQASEDAH